MSNEMVLKVYALDIHRHVPSTDWLPVTSVFSTKYLPKS